MDAAYEAELILRLAELTPDDGDPRAGHPGGAHAGLGRRADAVGVSEFFASELALVLNRGRGTANHLHHRARVWAETPARHLPRRWPPGTWTWRGPRRWPTCSAPPARRWPGRSRRSAAGGGRPVGGPAEGPGAGAAAGAGRRRRRGAPQGGPAVRGCVPAARRRRDGHPRARNSPPTRRPRPTRSSTSWRGWPRPTATPGRSAQIRAELFSLLLRRPGGHGQPGVAAQLTITATLDSLAGAVDAGGVGERAGHHRRARPRAAGPDRRPRAAAPPTAAGSPSRSPTRRPAAGHHHRGRAAAGRQEGLRRAPRRGVRLPGARRAARHRRL